MSAPQEGGFLAGAGRQPEGRGPADRATGHLGEGDEAHGVGWHGANTMNGGCRAKPEGLRAGKEVP